MLYVCNFNRSCGYRNELVPRALAEICRFVVPHEMWEVGELETRSKEIDEAYEACETTLSSHSI